MVKELFGWFDRFLKVCTLPEAFFVFIIVCTFEKYSLSNLIVLYFNFFINLNALLIITLLCKLMFLFRFY